ncbi:hypothetical protein DM01DRAFT_335957 [Hesseltinella vesiculosa]|uniref:Uncharacterized protein n=1 Tax=Hesseltinella vesiculosa TaxID=101127 RepID=A0A1X2G6K4_9FUNG|nr:hypothetical protein DM01DRAFT_335957 [Hesseltinella vesiculosa]
MRLDDLITSDNEEEDESAMTDLSKQPEIAATTTANPRPTEETELTAQNTEILPGLSLTPVITGTAHPSGRHRLSRLTPSEQRTDKISKVTFKRKPTTTPLTLEPFAKKSLNTTQEALKASSASAAVRKRANLASLRSETERSQGDALPNSTQSVDHE